MTYLVQIVSKIADIG
jgi:hypothetical protein